MSDLGRHPVTDGLVDSTSLQGNAYALTEDHLFTVTGSVSVDPADATASGDSVVIRVTLSATAADATASGDPVTIRAAVGANAADATASGDAVTIHVVVPVGSADATADGSPVSIAGDGLTVSSSPAEATASGDAVTVRITVAGDSASATATGTAAIIVLVPVDPGAATAGGDTVSPGFGATVSASSASATAGSGTVRLVISGPPVGGGDGQGLGAAASPFPGTFRIKLTSLHYPENTVDGLAARPASTLARLTDWSDASVEIPANDSRTARVTISMHDEACDHVRPLRTMLHVVYVTPDDAHLVFWGPLTQTEWSSESEQVTLYATDPSVRLQNHYLRFGDRVLNTTDDVDMPNAWGKGYAPLSVDGLLMLRDAAMNTDEQTARGVPDLGIFDGTDTTTPLPTDTLQKIKVERGAEVWSTMRELVDHEVSPDFELEPIDSIEGVYANLNTWPRQGNDDPTGLLLHDGWGRDNCRIDYTAGGRLVTHAHVLSRGDQKRVTIAETESSATYGIYVQWEATDYASNREEPLSDRGEQIIRRNGHPSDTIQVRLNQTSGLYYLDDFGVGDACRAEIRRGQLLRRVDAQITKVTLAQVDTAGNVVPQLEAATTPGTTESGEDV